MPELAVQLLLMTVQAAAAAGVLLAVFRFRRLLGLASLYVTVGVLYYLATLLAASTLIKVSPGLMMSPGSVALFPACLFAVLLVYIREDAREARNMIYGLLVANVFASLLGVLVGRQLASPLAVTPILLPPELFILSPRLFVVGTLALFADTILIILAYEAISRVVQPLFLRIWLSLALVLAFDTLLFVTGGFVEHPAYGDILLAGLLGKIAAALVYSAALTAYLPRAAVSDPQTADRIRPGLSDLFQVLTYRQKYEALRSQITRDRLTGIHNRGFLDDTLQAQLAAARRSGAPLAVMLIDADHFKRVNDIHGHSEGDRALRVIARALVRVARASDIVCRYGGEEFFIILPGTRLDAATQLAARIRDEVPAACLREGIGNGQRVTVTIGLAAFPDDGAEPDELLDAADRRLYRGKSEGRDRVVAD